MKPGHATINGRKYAVESGKKEPSALLAWRRKQPPEAIMKRATFRKLEKEKGTNLAGWIYWRTAEKKFGHRKS